MILFSVLMLAAQATAAPPATAETTVPAAAPAKVKEKQVCKVDPESDPGSHMVKRICHTQSEWNNQQGVLGTSRAGFSISGDKMEGH